MMLKHLQNITVQVYTGVSIKYYKMRGRDNCIIIYTGVIYYNTIVSAYHL